MPIPPADATAADSPSGELWARLQAVATAAGIPSMGVTTADPLEPARSVLRIRKARGLAATMQFTYRNPDRSTDPTRAMPSAASIVVAAWPYARAGLDHSLADAGEGGIIGRVAMYAWRDHYGDLQKALESVAETLRSAGHEAQIHLDDNHLVDRNVAYRAGLGWYGKNANLLLPDLGSWFVLGSIITDAPLESTGPPLADGCGPCQRCIDDCPTGAIVSPGVIDARRCLAWLVQGPGEIPVEFRAAVGDRIYGCDDCQDVCPPNLAVPRHQEIEADADPSINVLWILAASDEDLMARVGRWYIAKRDPNVVRRTALVILGNSASADDEVVRATIQRYRSCGDELLESHAEWAAEQLGLPVS